MDEVINLCWKLFAYFGVVNMIKVKQTF